MADKSWMLTPKAIRYANECIRIVKDSKGVRLKLSQPDFMQRLHEFVDSTPSSRELGDAYAHLLAMAGVGNIMRGLDAEPARAVIAEPIAVGDGIVRSSGELIHLGGKDYPRFRKGRELKGLYRGVPRYI